MASICGSDLCIGCGLCSDLCPDIFELGDDGLVHVIVEEWMIWTVPPRQGFMSSGSHQY